MNLINWNSRGTNSKGLGVLIRDMMKQNQSSFVVMLETHISGYKAKNIIHKIGL